MSIPTYTPEEEELRGVVNSLGGRWYYYVDDAKCWERLKAAALAYARPIVAEKCAEIAENQFTRWNWELSITEVPGPWQWLVHSDLSLVKKVARIVGTQIAAAIRDHGKGE